MRIALVTDTVPRVMRWLTHLGGATATIAVGLALVALGDRATGLAALRANLLSHVPVQILKRLVQRPRPCDALGRPLALVNLPDPFSFPSGHAAAATAVAVQLRVHHPSDVVAGACLGLAGAIAASAILREARVGRSLEPLHDRFTGGRRSVTRRSHH